MYLGIAAGIHDWLADPGNAAASMESVTVV
jgi:hypothetical protein